MSHTIYPYQQFLSVTQYHCHTQYNPINSPYTSHIPTVTHNISLSTDPIRHKVPLSHSPTVTHDMSLSTVPNRHKVSLSHTIHPYQQSLSVTYSQCYTKYIPINSPYPSHSPQCHTQYIPSNSSYTSHSPNLTHNISLSTVPIRHIVLLSHTIYSYQQSLSVTQSHYHTQYIPINSPYPSHSPNLTNNISLSTVPIRHKVPLSHTIYP